MSHHSLTRTLLRWGDRLKSGCQNHRTHATSPFRSWISIFPNKGSFPRAGRARPQPDLPAVLCRDLKGGGEPGLGRGRQSKGQGLSPHHQGPALPGTDHLKLHGDTVGLLSEVLSSVYGFPSGLLLWGV